VISAAMAIGREMANNGHRAFSPLIVIGWIKAQKRRPRPRGNRCACNPDATRETLAGGGPFTAASLVAALPRMRQSLCGAQ